MDGFLSIDGQITKADSALIPATDRFFLYGDGLYEILAATDGTLLDFDRHMSRLRRSTAECCISMPWTDEEIRFEIEYMMSMSLASRHSVRLIISRGIGGKIKASGHEKSRRYIFCDPINESLDPFKKSIKIRTLNQAPTVKGTSFKTNSYLMAISATLRSQINGFDDICWINQDGEILECGFSNIFLISRHGDLVEIATPPVESGILPGITRGRLIDLLNNAGIPVTERSITTDELARFDEAFVSSSLCGLVPVNYINNHKLHTVRKNSVFHEISRLYAAWVTSCRFDNTLNKNNSTQ